MLWKGCCFYRNRSDEGSRDKTMQLRIHPSNGKGVLQKQSKVTLCWNWGRDVTQLIVGVATSSFQYGNTWATSFHTAITKPMDVLSEGQTAFSNGKILLFLNNALPLQQNCSPQKNCVCYEWKIMHLLPKTIFEKRTLERKFFFLSYVRACGWWSCLYFTQWAPRFNWWRCEELFNWYSSRLE